MPISRLAAISFAMLAALGSVAALAQAPAVDPAIASMTPDQMVAARQAAMKEDGGALKAAFSQTGAEAEASAAVLLKNFTNFPALFKEGSLTDKSEALPLIWTEFDKFSAIFVKDQGLAADMLAAAKSGDQAAYLTAAKAIGASCGECHQTYRKKD